MIKKFLFGLIIFINVVYWPISIYKNNPTFSTKSIFYSDELGIYNNNKKYQLSGIIFNKLFYNKYFIYLRRYVSNVMNMVDINNYFFNGHPRENLENYVSRYKFPYISVIPFFTGIIFIIRNWKKEYKGYLLSIIVYVLVISIFKTTDGFDFLLFFPLSYIIGRGYYGFLSKIW